MITKPSYQELEKELEILKRQENSKLLMHLVNAIFIEIDFNGVVSLVNKKACEVLGYEEKEIIGKNWFENFIPERFRSEIIPISKKILSGEIETTEYYENPVLTKSGEERLIYWHNTIVRDQNGIIRGHLSSGEDITERKITVEKLNEATKIIERSPVVAFLWKNVENWPVEYVSKNVDKIFGYNVDEFISGKIVYSDLIHPDDFKVVSNEIIENVDSVSISHKIYRVFSKNGEIKWIKNETFIRRDENGQITHYEGILFDVSEQEKTLQKLKIANIKRIESENKYKNIIETLNDWIWEIDNTGKYTYVNPKVFSILGYSENEVLGKTPFDFMPENEKSRLLNVFNDIMRHQGPINKVENINIHKNGTFVVIETSGLPFYDSDNNVLGYRGIDRDITLRKKAEVELLLAKEKVERSEKRFKKISELTFEGIIMHRGGIVIDINKSFVKLSGYEIEELVGKNIIEQLIPPKYHKTIALKMEEKHPSPYDIEFIRKDGTLIPVEIESYSDNYDNKEIRVTVVRDIREKKESEKRVLNAMIEAEERERERFARELHDGLGPLLSTLKMYFQWLADTREEKKIELILSQARENIEEAISTVEEISNNITPRTLNAFGIKAAVRTFIGRLLGVNDVDINFYCSFETRIDQNIEIAIYRIITELINNTLKYANAGQISISITLNTESTNIAVQYYDNGNGFNYEETIKANKGFGLGNIRQRIKMLGSFLEYKTEVGRGVNVYFECKV